MSLFEQASLVVTPNAYKSGKLYSIKPTDGSGDLDVVRATSATRVNASGLIEVVGNNIPRLDYTNASCPSILVEPQRTNLLTYSEQFDNTSWTKTRATITSNTTTAPDGTLTADKLILSIDSNTHFIEKSGIAVTAQIYSATVYAKKGEYDTVRLLFANLWGNPNPNAIFNLTTKSIVSTQNATAKITELTNGWFKLEITSTINATAGSNGKILIYGGNNGNVNLVGDGTSGIYIWGAQFEAGANATSYIPTVGSAVTRNADVISKTGIGSVFNTNKGTIFCDFIAPSISNVSQYIFDLSDNVNNVTNRLAFYKIAAGTYQLFTNIETVVTINTNTRNKVAITWNGSTVKIYANGALKSTITYANANPTKINLGSRFNNVEIGNVNYNLVTAFATDLTDQQCIDLTTL